MFRLLIIAIIIAVFLPNISKAGCTSRLVGNITYFNCDDGTSGTSYTVGGTTYYNYNPTANKPIYQPFTPQEINNIGSSGSRGIQESNDRIYQEKLRQLELQKRQLELQKMRNE